MKLLKPLYNINGALLLKKDTVLTARHIKSLKRSGILAVHVYSQDKFEVQEENIISEQICVNAMNALQNWVKNNKRVMFCQVVEIVESITEDVLAGKGVAEKLSDIYTADLCTYVHSVDVCILSLTVGAKLGYHKKKLLHLGIGSLLHDLGKTVIPIEIINKPGKLSPIEYSTVQKHSIYGYELARDSDISRHSMEIILNHHERYDGSGYPRGLNGEEINELCAICSLADVYNAMTANRSYRDALAPSEVYEFIMASRGTMFHPQITDRFLKCLIPYPVGTIVELSNGLTGRVTKINSALPLRPVVTLLDQGNMGEDVDLSIESSIVITGLVKQQDLQLYAAN